MGSSQRHSARVLGSVLVILAIVVLALVALASAAEAARHGTCASADVDEPVRLPDGNELPAGRLTLCETRDYSPVSSLHTIGVDGHPVALMVSRRGFGEGEALDTPFLMLVRDGTGQLHLAGYATPAGDRMVTYELFDLRGGRRARTIAWLPPGDDGGAGTQSLLLAARVD